MRGVAVDLTLVDLKTGACLDMGTAFDDFSEKAHLACTTISENAQKNRAILKQAMEKHGFLSNEYEWWHYTYNDWEKYPPLGVDFEDLNKH